MPRLSRIVVVSEADGVAHCARPENMPPQRWETGGTPPPGQTECRRNFWWVGDKVTFAVGSSNFFVRYAILRGDTVTTCIECLAIVEE